MIRIVGGIAFFAICLAIFPSDSTGKPFSPISQVGSTYDEVATFLKEYLKILDKAHNTPAQTQKISGQVNLRPPRSELVGDMAHALRLYQLQELDRMYGQKSRPRFGKRSQLNMNLNEVPVAVYGSFTESDNAIPLYEDRRRR